MPEKNYLQLHMSEIGNEAFETLSKADCDPEFLGNMFVLLRSSVVTLTPKGGTPLAIRSELGASWKQILFPVEKSELQRIAKRTKELVQDIGRLRKSEFVRYLVATGVIAKDDLLAGSPLESTGLLRVTSWAEAYFQGLLRLPELAKQFGPRMRPDYTRRLVAIFHHIREHTGQWHDARVADILNDLLPDRENPSTADSLKAWRHRHDLTD